MPILPDGNDATIRSQIWRRHAGDAWAAFETLPPAIRRRLSEHAYDAWTVNALALWRRFQRIHRTQARAERAMLRAIDHCERLERRAFSAAWEARWGTRFPHDAAGVSVLRSHPLCGETTARDSLPHPAASAAGR
ncbi:DUF6525 family protein [Acetobacteraceae bacterium KSS8]|uniref:DUF6525 family protein n=1 Tax=Endosaccharibacter trunci TaxID=2812733 RepID=A0ABT1WCQ9_9PROT|nr:DUF6525 family protein [Acetobacteraceae bacterium KSS8]